MLKNSVHQIIDQTVKQAQEHDNISKK